MPFTGPKKCNDLYFKLDTFEINNEYLLNKKKILKLKILRLQKCNLRISRETVSDNNDFILASGFKNAFHCSQLLEVVSLGDYYKKKQCVKDEDYYSRSSHAKMLDGEQEYEKHSLQIVGNKPPKKEKKKLSGGAIAGIVIACIVVVAALMVGEYFLIKKLSKGDASENEAEEV